MTEDDNAPWFSPKHKPAGIPRQRYAGEEVWRLHDHTGQIMSCELRDQSTVDAGWDVLESLRGEPLFSRRCSDQQEARFVAEAIRQDNVRGGWEDPDMAQKAATEPVERPQRVLTLKELVEMSHVEETPEQRRERQEADYQSEIRPQSAQDEHNEAVLQHYLELLNRQRKPKA